MSFKAVGSLVYQSRALAFMMELAAHWNKVLPVIFSCPHHQVLSMGTTGRGRVHVATGGRGISAGENFTGEISSFRLVPKFSLEFFCATKARPLLKVGHHSGRGGVRKFPAIVHKAPKFGGAEIFP